ncbi:MAG: hypothetical protein GY940_11525 [bacterium]|nr:hypothetical protein [bacterium]
MNDTKAVTGILNSLINTAPKIKTRIQLTGLIIGTVAFLLSTNLVPEKILPRIIGGLIGLPIIFFGMVFHFLKLIPEKIRANFLLRLLKICFSFLLVFFALYLVFLFLPNGNNHVSPGDQFISNRMNQSIGNIKQFHTIFAQRNDSKNYRLEMEDILREMPQTASKLLDIPDEKLPVEWIIEKYINIMLAYNLASLTADELKKSPKRVRQYCNLSNWAAKYALSTIGWVETELKKEKAPYLMEAKDWIDESNKRDIIYHHKAVANAIQLNFIESEDHRKTKKKEIKRAWDSISYQYKETVTVREKCLKDALRSLGEKV